MPRVLFVCLGNICRSPTAEAVMAQLVADAGLEHAIELDSAGTGGWHVGSPPDARATAAAKVRMLREFDPAAAVSRDVPDPYCGGEDGFDRVLDLVEAARAGLLAELRSVSA